MRREGHKHRPKCLMEPDIAALIFIPILSPEMIYKGIFLVLIDVYACIIGVKIGKREIINNKSLEGSIGAYFVFLISSFFLVNIYWPYLFILSVLGVFVELFATKVGLKDNFLLAFSGILYLALVI